MHDTRPPFPLAALGLTLSACAQPSAPIWDGELEDGEACFHREIPQSTGDPAVIGTTSFASNDDRASCAIASGPDLRYLWVPDTTRTYRIHTSGSTFDTVLTVLDGCEGNRVACNDDVNDFTSQVTVDAVAFREYVIIVDGYLRSDQGEFQLVIQ